MNFVSDARLLELPHHAREDGEVVVAEVMAHVPFTIARLFTVRAPLNTQRGKHAHRRCTQFMICVHGAIEIVCDDGSGKCVFTLNRGNLALHVPPGIWNTVIFHKEDSVLAVLCDRVYEAHDYIRDYAEYLSFRDSVHA
jgi:dTDP-4-dehydrorhamnose 3,5-epimerase-like enzyme